MCCLSLLVLQTELPSLCFRFIRGNVEINKNFTTEKWSGAEKQHSHIQISDLDYSVIL